MPALLTFNSPGWSLDSLQVFSAVAEADFFFFMV